MRKKKYTVHGAFTWPDRSFTVSGDFYFSHTEYEGNDARQRLQITERHNEVVTIHCRNKRERRLAEVLVHYLPKVRIVSGGDSRHPIRMHAGDALFVFNVHLPGNGQSVTTGQADRAKIMLNEYELKRL